LPRYSSTAELFGEKLSNAIFRIIKRAPGPRASYEAGVTTFFYKLQVEGWVPARHIPDFVENFGWQHGVVNRAQ
jgi:hypothetical protein